MRKLLLLMTVSGLLAGPCRAQEAVPPGEKENYTFLRLLAAAKENPDDTKALERLMLFASKMNPKPPIPVEAKKLYIKGMAEQIDAVNDDDFDKAAKLYARAIQIAPWWAQCYFNMGRALESGKRFREADEALRLYNLAAPPAKTAARQAPRRKKGEKIPDFSGDWGNGMDCWRYEFELKDYDLTITMRCWDFPGTVYGSAVLEGRQFEGSSTGGPAGSGMGVHYPIRFKGDISEDDSTIEMSSILAPELAADEATQNAAMDQVRVFGEPAWTKQTWHRVTGE